MDPLRKFLDKQHQVFVKGGKLEKLYPLYEAIDTFLYTPGEVSKGSVHVRDGIDLKRTMITVAMALLPCILMAMYNTGLQSLTALQGMGVSQISGWRGLVYHSLGFGIDQTNIVAAFFLGALYFVPVFIVTNVVGGLCELIFSVVRKHEINEGFLVTGLLYPLTLPPAIPLWQVAIGIIFGVVVGKEIFGGTGKNFLNPALTARAFLFFAYPAEISGNAVWTAADGYTGATLLGQAAEFGMATLSYTWTDAFLGFIPGSMGETSTIACIFGAFFLILTGIGSWRTMLSMTLSTVFFAGLLNFIGSSSNPMFEIPAHWHLVMGSFAFGCVFMATDPVSSAMTDTGRYFYGALIGFMVILVRSINPAYPEGVMLAILFGNVFAPLIDYFVVSANIKRRKLRYAKG
ncbi:MAG: NADH:ubiquinone reductase (Na(+)-transporting) subunit B [Zetaproteobacteria bacterium]|nr:NADH:ubiquinone reductase (Na(+)-transporting) subunit B [Pseudobdellovibrionaceae bacterium]